MTVKELVKQLKNLPQNLEVGIAAHNNEEWEAIAWPHSIYYIYKHDYYTSGDFQESLFADLPDEYIVLHC